MRAEQYQARDIRLSQVSAENNDLRRIDITDQLFDPVFYSNILKKAFLEACRSGFQAASAGGILQGRNISEN